MSEKRIVEVYIANTPNDAGGWYTYRLQIREDGTGIYWTDAPVEGLICPDELSKDEVHDVLYHWGLDWDLVQVAE